MSDEELGTIVESDESLEAESAPAELEQAQPKSNRNPDVEKRISKLTSQLYHKDSELNQLRAENETLKKIGEREPEPTSVPEFPSEDLRYDNPDEFKRQAEAYHKAVALQAYKAAQEDAQRVEREQRDKEQRDAQQAQFKSIVDKYVEGGLESGISEDRMLANEQILKQYNLNQDIAKRLYSHEKGAQVVDFLVNNPDKLQSLAGMDTPDAAVSIAIEILPQALSMKPNTTNAPDPVEPTHGGGIPPSDGLMWIKGATFE